jgi:hypothetical protein
MDQQTQNRKVILELAGYNVCLPIFDGYIWMPTPQLRYLGQIADIHYTMEACIDQAWKDYNNPTRQPFGLQINYKHTNNSEVANHG